MPVKRFDITERVWAHLRACSAQRMPLADAAREVGCVQTTLRRAAERAGRYEELCTMFNAEVTGSIRRLKPEDVAHLPLTVEAEGQAAQVRWLTTSWRATA